VVHVARNNEELMIQMQKEHKEEIEALENSLNRVQEELEKLKESKVSIEMEELSK
jgi:HAMP domain-containing protein